MAQNAAVRNLVIEEDSKYWAYAPGIYILKMLFTYLYTFKHCYSYLDTIAKKFRELYTKMFKCLSLGSGMMDGFMLPHPLFS